MLSPRTETILKSIVEQYIARAVPVASQSITSDYDLGVSSATIRNEMMQLEHEGHITRPHTSSGSIPTDKGYRYYVALLSDVKLPLAQQRMISHLFHQVETEFEEWSSLAATILAHLAHNMAVVAMPRPANCQFKYLEVISIQDATALVVLVLHGARLKQQLITFKEATSQPELVIISNKLTAAYSSLTSPQISAKKIGLAPAEQQVTDCVVKMMQAEDEEGYEGPYLDGLHFMFEQPEFTNALQAQKLVELTEHKDLMRVLVPHGVSSQGVQVVIGTENAAEAIQNYSVVISHYGLPDEAMGNIAIVGPTRMPYARSIAAIDYLSNLLSLLVAKLYGREEPAEQRD